MTNPLPIDWERAVEGMVVEDAPQAIPTRCRDGSLNWQGLEALDLYRDAMEARRCARIYADRQGFVDRKWAYRALSYFRWFRIRLEQARKLADA